MVVKYATVPCYFWAFLLYLRENKFQKSHDLKYFQYFFQKDRGGKILDKSAVCLAEQSAFVQFFYVFELIRWVVSQDTCNCNGNGHWKQKVGWFVFSTCLGDCLTFCKWKVEYADEINKIIFMLVNSP